MIVTHDCSLLRFLLFCSHAGILKSAERSLRVLFKNIFVVIKPGSRKSSSGKTVHLLALPQVDVDKVTKYIANQKRKQAGAEEGDQGTLNKSYQTAGGKAEAGTSTAGGKHSLTSPYHVAKQVPKVQSTFSLSSYKSQKQLESLRNAFDVQREFNSFQSSIRQDLLPPLGAPTLITIVHEPFTHLNSSRIQHCFKIYNEFVHLTFKNRLIYAQPSDYPGPQDFSKAEAARICKLGSHMGIKDLPKKHNNLRTPLLEIFRNHRMLGKIKEQIIRFVHRILNEENNISYNFSNAILIGNCF